MIGRRSFVSSLIGAVALGGVGACAAGEHRGRSPLGRIGAQLYTVRRAMARDFEGTLQRVREIGFDEVEFAGYFGRTPRQVRDAISRSGMAAPAAHVELATIESDWDRALDDANVMGHDYLVLAWIAPERRAAADDWRRLAALLVRGGEAARAAGIRLAYHNHDYEFASVEGVVPFDLLVAETDPSVVAFELDVYWMMKAGRDPLDYLARRPARFELLHLKDTAGPPDHVMTDVGAGIADWAAVMKRAMDAGARHWFVEHDEPADPFGSLGASYDYLRARHQAVFSTTFMHSSSL